LLDLKNTYFLIDSESSFQRSDDGGRQRRGRQEDKELAAKLAAAQLVEEELAQKVEESRWSESTRWRRNRGSVRATAEQLSQDLAGDPKHIEPW